MSDRVFDNKMSIGNKLLNEDGSITDLVGNAVVNATDLYKSKSAIPNKFLNPDGSYSTLSEILGGIIDTDIFIIVEELPDEGLPNKIYLLVVEDKLIEYVWVNNKWDPIGMVEFDITNYYTKEEVRQLIAASLNEAKGYTDNKIGNINTILDTINGEVV